MARFGLCGPTYQSLSPSLDAQFTMNWYLEQDESQNGRSAMAMYPTPGLSLVATLPGCSAVVGEFAYVGRHFAVGQVIPTTALIETYPSFTGFYMNIWEVLADGSLIQCAGNFSFPSSGVTGVNVAGAPMVGTGQGLVSIVGTPVVNGFGKQDSLLIVVTNGWLYYFSIKYDLLGNPNPLTAFSIVNNQSYAVGEWVDTFLITLLQQTSTQQNQFQIFGPGGTQVYTYNALNIATVTSFPDNVVAMSATDRMIIFFGEKRSIPYYNSGALFPFIPVPGVLIEQGCAALHSPVRADNSIFWIGADERGAGIAYRNNGYTPQRISTFPVETAWRQYSTIADAQGYSYQDMGHTFVVWNFPTGNATWVYDVANQMWHQRGHWNTSTGQFDMQLQQVHAYCFGKHFVGDSQSGNIYEQNISFLADNGNNIRRVRRAPSIAKEHDYIFHNTLEVLADMNPPSNIPAPSSFPTAYYIPDQQGNTWALSVLDAGNMQISGPVPNTAQTIVIADNAVAGQYWQLLVVKNLSGQSVLATEQIFTQKGPASLPISTTYGALDSTIYVAGGLVQSQQGLIHIRAPQVFLRWSDDGGHVWSNYYPANLGETGEYKTRAIWRRLGRSRNRVYEISCSDPYPFRIIDGYINGDPGDKAQERLSDQMRKMA